MTTQQITDREVHRWLAEGFSHPQITGIACVCCDKTDGPMMPSGQGPLGTLFRHVDCPEPSLEHISAASS